MSFLSIASNVHDVCVEVSFYYKDMTPADAKGVGRKVLDKLHEIYYSDLARMHYAYDGEKTLFTVGPLPKNKEEFTVPVEERSSVRYNS